jgi:hypothetical protein
MVSGSLELAHKFGTLGNNRGKTFFAIDADAGDRADTEFGHIAESITAGNFVFPDLNRFAVDFSCFLGGFEHIGAGGAASGVERDKINDHSGLSWVIRNDNVVKAVVVLFGRKVAGDVLLIGVGDKRGDDFEVFRFDRVG